MERSLYSNKYQDLRTWLVEQRNKAQLTIRELAAKLDVHHSIIGKIEQGERKLDVVEYVDYCKALDCDPLEGIRRIESH